MANLTLNAPVKGLTSPVSWGSRETIKQMMKNIMAKYGSFFKFASKTSKIPVNVLVSFTAVESGGNPNAGASGHVTQGLMQWNRTYAKSQLETELREGRMSNAEKSKLAEFGIVFTNGKCREITNADQLKPELNILIGSIILGQLIDTNWGTEIDSQRTKLEAMKLVTQASLQGQFLSSDKALQQVKDKFLLLRLDRIIAVYNAGAYGSIGEKARLGHHPNAKALADDISNPTTNAYIRKIMGVNGALDIAKNELKNILV